jgi:hypothetical protein
MMLGDVQLDRRTQPLIDKRGHPNLIIKSKTEERRVITLATSDAGTVRCHGSPVAMAIVPEPLSNRRRRHPLLAELVHYAVAHRLLNPTEQCIG